MTLIFFSRWQHLTIKYNHVELLIMYVHFLCYSYVLNKTDLTTFYFPQKNLFGVALHREPDWASSLEWDVVGMYETLRI